MVLADSGAARLCIATMKHEMENDFKNEIISLKADIGRPEVLSKSIEQMVKPAEKVESIRFEHPLEQLGALAGPSAVNSRSISRWIPS